MQKLVLASVVCGLLAACSHAPDVKPAPVSEALPPETAAPAPAEPAWRQVASSTDRDRIDGLDQTWRGLLNDVPSRSKSLVDREGDLLDPGAQRARPEPSPGSYICHLVKLGDAGQGDPPVKSFPDFVCYIRAEADNRLSFTKQTGTELPGGWFYEDGDKRLVMLGARQKAPGDNSLAYGTDAERDLIGTLDRIGPFRWRLVLPWRDGKTGLDIYELKPAPVDAQVAEPVPAPAG